MTPEESERIARSESMEGLYLAAFFGSVALVVFAAIVLAPALLTLLARGRSQRADAGAMPSLVLALLGCVLYLPVGVGAFYNGVAFANRTLNNGTLPELAVVRNLALAVALPAALLCVLLPKRRLLVWFIGFMVCLAVCGAVGVWGPP